jgi:thioredoxin reductase (NADPH)
VLIATGARYRRLAVPGIDSFVGSGVFYTAPAEAKLVSGRDVVVAGGGNSAGQSVLHLARYARSVMLVVRGDDLESRMSEYLIKAIRRAENVDVRLATEVTEVTGLHNLEGLTIRSLSTGAVESVRAQLVLVMIGALPQTEWLADAVQCDDHGFVLTGGDVAIDGGRRPRRLETSMPGVFAAGDVRHGAVKRVASAVGEGAIAVQLMHEYLAEGEAAEETTPLRATSRGGEAAREPAGASVVRGPALTRTREQTRQFGRKSAGLLNDVAVRPRLAPVTAGPACACRRTTSTNARAAGGGAGPASR